MSFAWHKFPPHLETIRWSEADIQSFICVKLDDWLQDVPGLFAYETSLEGIKLTIGQAKKAKALGMKSGVPDFRFYLPSDRLVSIELKTSKGSVSTNQKERHALLKKLGFKVHVIKAKSPTDGWNQVYNILQGI